MENKDTREPKLGISLSMVTEEKLIFCCNRSCFGLSPVYCMMDGEDLSQLLVPSLAN